MSSSDNPASFDDPALWADSPEPEAPTGAESPTAEPAAPEGATEQPPADATIPPAATTEPAAGVGTGSETGPIPPERHKAILEAERAKRSDLEGKLQRVAWAEELISAGHEPDAIHEALRLYQGVDQDPVGFIDRFVGALSQHPEYQQALRGWLGRIGQPSTPSSTTPGKPAAADDKGPGPDVYWDDPKTGERLWFYSDKRLAEREQWIEQRQRAALGGLEQRFSQLEGREAQRAREAAIAQITADVNQQVEREVAEWRKKPHFAQHEPAIKAWMREHGYKRPLSEAYLHILETKVMPGLSTAGKDELRAELQRQAGASSVAPGASGGSAPGDVTSFDDPRLKW